MVNPAVSQTLITGSLRPSYDRPRSSTEHLWPHRDTMSCSHADICTTTSTKTQLMSPGYTIWICNSYSPVSDLYCILCYNYCREVGNLYTCVVRPLGTGVCLFSFLHLYIFLVLRVLHICQLYSVSSFCLSVVCNVCVVAKRCVLPKNWLKKQIGNYLWGNRIVT